MTETLAASALVPDVRPLSPAWDADRVVTEIYHSEYKSLVRLAVLLVHDVPTAEEVVQDAFEAMHTAWRRLREKEKALSYLRQAVVNKSRSVLRHRTVVDRNAPKPAPDEPSAEHGALALIERSAVIAALRTLPDRQREAVVPAVLRRSVRSRHRRDDGDQQGRREEPHRTRDGGAEIDT